MYKRKPQRFPLIGALNGRSLSYQSPKAHAAGFAPLLCDPYARCQFLPLK